MMNVTDSKLKIRSYQYLEAKGYKPFKVGKQFSEVAKIPNRTVKQIRAKMDFKFT